MWDSDSSDTEKYPNGEDEDWVCRCWNNHAATKKLPGSCGVAGKLLYER